MHHTPTGAVTSIGAQITAAVTLDVALGPAPSPTTTKIVPVRV